MESEHSKLTGETKSASISIRYAKVEDANQIRRIYAPYVLETAITFEYDVPSKEEFKQRITQTLKHHPYIVAENDKGQIIGYAYASSYYERAAYDHSVELSIYVEKSLHGKGIGRVLYETLEEELRKRGILNLTACIAWTDEPNQYLTHQSPDFHKKLGYEKCAHFHKIGYKFGRWFDIIWMEKMLGEHIDESE